MKQKAHSALKPQGTWRCESMAVTACQSAKNSEASSHMYYRIYWLLPTHKIYNTQVQVAYLNSLIVAVREKEVASYKVIIQVQYGTA